MNLLLSHNDHWYQESGVVLDCIDFFLKKSLTSDNDQILIDRVFVERKIPDLCPLSYYIPAEGRVLYGRKFPCELNISCTSTTAESRAKIWYQ